MSQYVGSTVAMSQYVGSTVAMSQYVGTTVQRRSQVSLVGGADRIPGGGWQNSRGGE